MSNTISYISPVGMLGGGFTESYFNDAVARHRVDFIAVDSGSTDGGANNLGADLPFNSREAIKRDLRILVRAARRHRIPLLVGSCGGSGGNYNLDWVHRIVREIAGEDGLSFTTALIPAEADRDVLVEKYRAGKIRALKHAPRIDESTLRDTRGIVAMMGAEPIIAALEGGADVVLAGRSSDAALFAAVPLMRGLPAGLAWHAAKIMECGGAAVAQMTKPEGMVCTLTQECFELEPVSPEQSCTPISVASHALYETANPLVMLEPGGAMHLEDVTYEAVDERRVRVRGSRFEEHGYTVKLEGAALVGYRSQVFGGITDPVILRDFEAWFEQAKDGALHAVVRTYGQETVDKCSIAYRVYGRNAVMPARPAGGGNDHEVAVLLLVTAPTQELAHAIAYQAGHTMHHFPVPRWQGLVSNLAFPVTPHVTDLGPAYSFVLNHVVELEDPLELFRIDYSAEYQEA
ncbi:acyclic terpene utilization AtuA family protein [Arthrobacter sp. GCM10027362]|uniref:acyclic terpene utilization AtuA family protein n=1 Tax=Arthrobacter sp. GCM10027362 TaxID=3273379 RepID=UPI0036427A85